MLTPVRLTQLMMEVVFILLGALVVWLGAMGHIYFDRRGAAFLLIFSGCPSLETGDSRAGSPTQ